mgnify:CR=1 FL=1
MISGRDPFNTNNCIYLITIAQIISYAQVNGVVQPASLRIHKNDQIYHFHRPLFAGQGDDSEEHQEQKDLRQLAVPQAEISDPVEPDSLVQESKQKRKIDDVQNQKQQNQSHHHRRDQTPSEKHQHSSEHTAISAPAGPLYDKDSFGDEDMSPPNKFNRKRKKKVLILCTGGTLTMAKDPNQDNALAPVQGSLTKYLKTMTELTDDPDMPEIVAHEYSPLIDSSDMGPGDWAVLASDIGDNYHYFDGFVVLSGTDTMAYAASALSFMLESLGKPVVFTGSQIPLVESFNDAR